MEARGFLTRELIFIPVLRMSIRFAEIRFLRSDYRLTQQYIQYQSIHGVRDTWPYAHSAASQIVPCTFLH